MQCIDFNRKMDPSPLYDHSTDSDDGLDFKDWGSDMPQALLEIILSLLPGADLVEAMLVISPSTSTVQGPVSDDSPGFQVCKSWRAAASSCVDSLSPSRALPQLCTRSGLPRSSAALGG